MGEVKFISRRKYLYEDASVIATGNSFVCKAKDIWLDRTVCLKRTHLSGSDEQVRAMLPAVQREVKALTLAGDRTTRVPSVLDTWFDPSNIDYYIVMQWIEGETLKVLMEQPITPSRFLQWMIDLCGILSRLEKVRVYHKDIKPENIIINQWGELYLIDFNISLGTPNLLEGTQYYKAPEMDSKSKYTGREKVDMFAVGVMLYHFFTGVLPCKPEHYARKSGPGVFEWSKFVEPRRLKPEIPECINSIIVACMKLDPRQRYANAAALQRALIDAQKRYRRQ